VAAQAWPATLGYSINSHANAASKAIAGSSYKAGRPWASTSQTT
jgi:hypothetical protein